MTVHASSMITRCRDLTLGTLGVRLARAGLLLPLDLEQCGWICPGGIHAFPFLGRCVRCQRKTCRHSHRPSARCGSLLRAPTVLPQAFHPLNTSNCDDSSPWGTQTSQVVTMTLISANLLWSDLPCSSGWLLRGIMLCVCLNAHSKMGCHVRRFQIWVMVLTRSLDTPLLLLYC